MNHSVSHRHLKKDQSPAPRADSTHTLLPACPVTYMCKHAEVLGRAWALGSEISPVHMNWVPIEFHVVLTTKEAKMKRSNPSFSKVSISCKCQNANLIAFSQWGELIG